MVKKLHKSCYRDSQGERFVVKLKNGLEKMRKKNSANCDKISHY